MKRSIWFWLYFIAAIVLAIYLSTRTVMTGLGRGPAAKIHTISVSADMRDKDLSELAAAVSLPPGSRTYTTDLGAVAARGAAVPGIKSVAVRRQPNGNLTVRAKIHRLVAQWCDGEHYFPLSEDGTIVNRPDENRDGGSVVFRGKLPADITDITRAAHNLIGDIDYLEWIEGRRWNIITNGGTIVMLPEDDPIAAIGTLLTLDKNHKILDKDLTVIDMRDMARILVR